MPYTLAKGLLWFALAFLLGLIIGYLLRSIVANRQIRSARAGNRPDHHELDKLRGRIANLEPVVAERDRLRSELAALRGETSGAPPETSAPLESPESTAPLEATVQAVAAVPGDEIISDSDPNPVPDEGRTDQTAVPDDTVADAEPTGDVPNDDVQVESEPEAATGDASGFDADAAAAALGKRIKLDDLTVVEGIGPAIADLCHGIGIHTWAHLGATEVSLLRTMLNDAGPRFRVHEPDTWPEQAELLATGRWGEFVTLTDALDHGKRTDG